MLGTILTLTAAGTMIYFLKKLFGEDSSSTNSSIPPQVPTWQPSPQNTNIQMPQIQTSTARNYFTINPSKPVSSSTGGGQNWFKGTGSAPSVSQGQLTVYDYSGSPLRLGKQEELASGGEGTVYSLAVASKNPLLVKVYKPETLKDKKKIEELLQRIADMTNIKACNGMDFLAWPLMPVFMDPNHQQVAGFVMRKVTGHTFRSLHYAPQINKFFPGWDRRDIVLVAIDFVKKIRLLALNGVIVNDFNPANFLVKNDHSVNFIDCDSYQVPSTKGGYNITKTFFDTMIAPELLMNKQLMTQPRNMQHLTFAVGLTVFQLLMCGMHPYAHCGGGTPQENLLQGKCGLGTGAGAKLPTGFYEIWSWLPYNLKSCFIKMFRDGHADPAARPSLETLEQELKNFLLLIDRYNDPERRALVPKNAKPKKSSSCVA